MARALAVRPKLLLLDEPFSALDAKVRKDLRNWLRKIHSELDVTTILVTHDQEEALEVSDRIAILNRGLLEQLGTPQAIYDHPASPFVYNFLGNVNLFHGRVLQNLTRSTDLLSADQDISARIGFVRPHEFDVSLSLPADQYSVLAKIVRVHAAGPQVQLEASLSGGANLVSVELTKARFQELSLQEGQQIFLTPQHIQVFEDKMAAEQLLEQGAGI